MRFEVRNSLGKHEAMRRIDGEIEKLRSKPLPAGVEVSDFSKIWLEDTLSVALRAGKGVFKVTVTASAAVFEEKVIVDLELPMLMKGLLSEATVEEGVKRTFAPLLGA